MTGGVVLRGVGKRYGGAAPVLDGVDLAIRPGEVATVGGGNGSGKSTLLRIVVGLTAPTAGTVSGRPRQIGYVPERFPGHQRMPALSYLVHMGRVRGLGTRAARARAIHLLDRLGLVGGAGSPLRTLSKGNAQKVAVAQALMRPPELAVLDEPWSGLDAVAHETLAALITDLAGDGCAVLFTDHRESVAPVRADRAYHLERGRLTVARQSRQQSPPALVVCAHGSGTAWSWRRLPGVRSVSPAGPGEVEIRVSEEHCDELLAIAVRTGWSVRRVERHPARRVRR